MMAFPPILVKESLRRPVAFARTDVSKGKGSARMSAAATLNAAAVYVALHILLAIALAVLVMLARRRLKVGLGDGGKPELVRAMRAHGNAAEQLAPTLAILILLPLLSAPAWALHVFGAVTFVARILHASGIHRSAGPTLGRVLGMSLTWASLCLACIGLLALAAR
jgi:uncharacterized protein